MSSRTARFNGMPHSLQTPEFVYVDSECMVAATWQTNSGEYVLHTALVPFRVALYLASCGHGVKAWGKDELDNDFDIEYNGGVDMGRAEAQLPEVLLW